jgi:alkyl sulfatase BDS1-like metallo-beta-lactamase superfamily hydrolase
VLEHVVHADDDKQAARELKATALGRVACMAEA